MLNIKPIDDAYIKRNSEEKALHILAVKIGIGLAYQRQKPIMRNDQVKTLRKAPPCTTSVEKDRLIARSMSI